MSTLTSEQIQVIHHPQGEHAIVLAVAGSGKTTTMCNRVAYLINNLHISPNKICILMFNQLARQDFNLKLKQKFQSLNIQIAHTFHSFCQKVRNQLEEQKLLPKNNESWTEQNQELVKINTMRAIEQVKRQRPDLREANFDVDDVMDAISLWKAELIPPQKDRAGHDQQHYADVYIEYEKIRLNKLAHTFDDSVPEIVTFFETHPEHLQEMFSQYQYVIVDEYQDVNHGQQRLVELIVSQGADLMVVGDDDQTIYEWRGARPDYILKHFHEIFNGKPIQSYILSKTFRFGPLIAQCAHQSIKLNTLRKDKPLISYHVNQECSIRIIRDVPDQDSNVDQEMCDEIIAQLIQEYKNLGEDAHQDQVIEKFIILGRTWSQLQGMESVFLQRKIPYELIGNRPFFKRREIAVLVDYLRLVHMVNEPLCDLHVELLDSVLNIPNRYITKEPVLSLLKTRKIESPEMLFSNWIDDAWVFFQNEAFKNRLGQFIELLKNMYVLSINPTINAYTLLDQLLVKTNFISEHLSHYYGVGEESRERIGAVQKFKQLVDDAKLSTLEQFLSWYDLLDHTQGRPESERLKLTTIYKTKGLEFDYVYIPDVRKGTMPTFMGNTIPIFDKKPRPYSYQPSPIIETERRLFYVAITRARKSVLISVRNHQNIKAPQDSDFIKEIQLDDTQALIQAMQKSNRTKDISHLQNVIQKRGCSETLIKHLPEYFSTNWIDVLQWVNQFKIEYWERKNNQPQPTQSPQTLNNLYQSNNQKKTSDIPWFLKGR
jgi:DNA helicase-2/ATP-dependent DNA helicase PcrA